MNYDITFCEGHNCARKEECHRYVDTPDDGMTDHDWDEAFGVAEYNDAK